MRFSRRLLDNGLKVIVIELPHVHSIELGMVVRSGPRFETGENLGISHFTEHMLFRGTQSIPGTFKLHAEVERLGSPIAAATARDFCQYNFSVPARNLERAMELFAEILLEPAFEDIELERKILIEEHLIDLDERGDDINIENHSRLLLWPGSPLGANILGNEANILGFERSDLFAHHQRFYTGENSVLYLAGAVETEACVDLARRFFGRQPRGERVPFIPVAKVVRGPAYKFIEHDDSQEQLCLSFVAPSYLDPDYIPMVALANLLSDGMSSRLQWRICEDLGMSYDIDAGLESYRDTGVFDIDASVGRGKLAGLLREVLMILAELRDKPVEFLELDKARARSRFANEFVLDSPGALASWLVPYELFHQAPSLEEIHARMEEVSAEDIQRVARRVFQSANLALVVEGRRSKVERNRFVRLINQEFSEEEAQ